MPVAQDRSLAQQLSRVFSIFGALVAVGFLLTALPYGISYFWLTPEFDRSRLALSAEGDALAAMIDEENGLRGYLFRHDTTFLAAYTRGRTGLARAHDILAVNVGTGLASAMLGTRLAEERWHERWADAAANAPPEAIAPSWLEGKALFDAYRGDEAAFSAALAQRNEALRLRERRLVAARVALELAIFIVIFFSGGSPASRSARLDCHPCRRVAAAHWPGSRWTADGDRRPCRPARAAPARRGPQRNGRRPGCSASVGRGP